MTMYCERYKCSMPEKTCLLRQKKYDSPVAYNAGNRDPGCADCAQGKQIKQQEKQMTHTAANTQAPAAGKAAGMDAAPDKPAQKRCPKCGNDLPADLDHFYFDRRGKYDLSCWCKECQRTGRRQSKRAAKARAAGKATPGPETLAAADVPEIEPEWTQPRPRRTVTLDFTDHAKMLGRIRAAAKASWRSVDQQIMAWAELGLSQEAEWTFDDDEKTPFGAQEETS